MAIMSASTVKKCVTCEYGAEQGRQAQPDEKQHKE